MKQHNMNCDCFECRIRRLEQPPSRQVETQVRRDADNREHEAAVDKEDK